MRAARVVAASENKAGLVAMGQAGWLNKSSVAHSRPAASRPAASGSDAVHVAPIKQNAATDRAMMVRSENDSQSQPGLVRLGAAGTVSALRQLTPCEARG